MFKVINYWHVIEVVAEANFSQIELKFTYAQTITKCCFSFYPLLIN